jgi:hypothetical protein
MLPAGVAPMPLMMGAVDAGGASRGCTKGQPGGITMGARGQDMV